MGVAEPVSVRQLAYALLITAAVGAAAGRILGVERVYEPSLSRDEKDSEDRRGLWPAKRPNPMPTHGDNDRSRWDTVRALVDEGTYVIGRREPGGDVGIITEDGWKTIDKVLKPDTQKFYSSKPPLLPTLVAGLYWLLKLLLGWSITADAWEVVKTILLLINWLPLLFYLLLLARLVERWGATNWGRIFVMTAACFGTLVTPFLTTFNNHTIATFAAVFALYPTVRIWEAVGDGKTAPAHLFLLSGFFAAFTACSELPALAFAVALGLTLLWFAPMRTLVLFAPAAAVPVAAFLLTNYLAIGQIRPAYIEFGGPWYEYAGSHWSNPQGKTGIDFARNVEGRPEYAFHVLLGHHGWFTLTPVWFFAAAGMIYGLVARRRERDGNAGIEPDGERPRTAVPVLLYALTLVVSVVVIGFYLVKSDNYGGWTSGLRWLMWLTPLWLLCTLPVVDALANRRWGRWLGYLFLAVSALTASYPAWSPWRHPWLYRWLDSLELLPY
jgi:hypothetical protein